MLNGTHVDRGRIYRGYSLGRPVGDSNGYWRSDVGYHILAVYSLSRCIAAFATREVKDAESLAYLKFVPVSLSAKAFDWLAAESLGATRLRKYNMYNALQVNMLEEVDAEGSAQSCGKGKIRRL